MHYKPNHYLSAGAHIRILCTARSAASTALSPAVQLLESWGLSTSYGGTVDQVHHQFGGDKIQRLKDFQDAMDDPEVDAIWIARGGYGTIQLMDGLDLSGQPKLILGYSDVTLLHALWQRHGWTSIHCFMPLELSQKPKACVQAMKQALLGDASSERVRINIENDQQLSPQQISASVVGGNLSILYSLLGSTDFPKTEGRILFIEEIDEYLYHIERMLYSLKRAGHLTGLRALLVGGMTDLRDHEIPFGKDVISIIKDVTNEYQFPVVFNFPAGHIADHRPIFLGQTMHINIQNQQIIFSQ
ncbi:S66 peptidase family protein [Nonlabens xiamenensis]|uniref:S66 peptidase family protein n=1 Tax=Nonlabens xiamenensis TaxID=2341043 RepID=UPI000F608094|nr:LD-carboxypeptidase [Nonlabens xiamenensis]